MRVENFRGMTILVTGLEKSEFFGGRKKGNLRHFLFTARFFDVVIYFLGDDFVRGVFVGLVFELMFNCVFPALSSNFRKSHSESSLLILCAINFAFFSIPSCAINCEKNVQCQMK